MRVLACFLLSLFTSFAFAQHIDGFSVTPYLAASSPTGIRFTGANEGFFIEQGGAVKRFAGGSVSTVLNLQVASGSERGLLGIALDPAFASNGLMYLYHSAGTPAGAWIDNRLSRYTWNGTTLVETPFATPRTFGSAADGQSQGPNHNGGPLLIRGGTIYGVTGDLNRNGIEQNQSSSTSAFTGGVYRLNTDGTVPAGNPFQSNPNPGVQPWYAYGVRNSFGIAVDPHPTLGGKIWFTENGPDAYDEINVLTPGMNSGWKQIMGPDGRDPQSTADLTMLAGATYQDPKFSFASPIGIAALQLMYGSAWGAAYNDALIFGEANSPNLWLLRLNAARDGFVLSGNLADGVFDSGDSLTPFGTGFNIITDIQVNPIDHQVYIAALGSNVIYRVALVPEPHTWLLALAGLAAIGWRARTRGARCRSS